MKKIFSFVCFLAMVLVASNVYSWGGNKYDVINSNPNYKTLVGEGYNSGLGSPKNVNWLSYFNNLVNYNDIMALVKSGELDKDKSEYLKSNANNFVKYLHLVIVNSFPKSIDERQIVYVNGVVTSKHAQAATTSSELQVEKQVLRAFPAYAIWEKFKAPGLIPQFVNEELDKLYKVSNK